MGSVGRKEQQKLSLNTSWIPSEIHRKTVLLTFFRKGELEDRGDEERQRAFGMVDFPASLAQPSRLSLVSYLIKAAIFSCHKNTPQVCGCDGMDVGVVCGD